MIYQQYKRANSTDRSVRFTAKAAFLSKEENRMCVIIPKGMVGVVGKRTVFEVTLRPVGSLLV